MRLRILPVLALALVLLLAVVSYGLHRMYSARLQDVVSRTAERAAGLVQTEIGHASAAMSIALEALTRDPDLKAAMRKRDAPALLAHAAPFFEKVRKEQGIEHFYFHDVERVNLLRVHDTHHSGDVIDRTTLKNAQRTQAPSSGIEQGPTGNCTLRVVYPWYDGSELLGYMELGTEFEHVASHVRSLMLVDVLVAVDKQFLKRDLWENRNKRLGRQSDWDAYSGVVVIDSTLAAIPKAVGASLLPTPSHNPPYTFHADDKSQLVVHLPLTDASQRQLGDVVVVSDITPIETQSLRSLFGVGGFCVAVGAAILCFFYVFLGRVGRELEARARGLADANATLEQRVAERTQELDKRNRDMRWVLDHVKEGLLTVDGDGRIGPERSAIIDEWFGTPASGVDLVTYLGQVSADAAARLEMAWAMIKGELAEVAVQQLPTALRKADRFFALDYIPIFEAGALQSMLVVISDATHEVERRRSDQAARELALVFERVLANKARFLEFFSEADRLVQAVLARAGTPHERARWIHTLKGNCAMFGISSVSELCERIEAGMPECMGEPSTGELSELSELWSRVSRTLAALTSDGERGRLEIGRDELERLIAAIHAGHSRADLAREAGLLKLLPTRQRLEQLRDQGTVAAARLGKRVQFVLEDNGLRLDAEAWAPFWSALVHSLRNAVDHGIEAPEERVALGKPAAGTLTLRTLLSAASFIVEVEDDGRGIDWSRVAERAREQGLAASTRLDLEQALFADGLSTRAVASEMSGRGVGLAALRASCVGLGGTVVVADAEATGARFQFVFPQSAMGDAYRPESSPVPFNLARASA